MQKVISFVTLKGGSGKSTSAMCLAAHWHKAGKKVAIVDADPAGTLVRWIDAGDELSELAAVPVGPEEIEPAIDRFLDEKYDAIIIDTPGFQSDATRTAIRRADLVIIPMRPSPVDYQIAVDTAEFIDNETQDGWDGSVRFLLNQTTRGSVIARHMQAQLVSAGFKPLDVELPSRVAYCEASLIGSTPSYYQPKGQAAKDISAFAGEIDTQLKSSSRKRKPRKRAGAQA